MELPGDVRKYIEAEFAPEHQQEAFSVILHATAPDGSPPNAQLLRCADVISRESLPQLPRLIGLLVVDWRDLIVAGEYEVQDKVEVRVRELSDPLQV